MNRLEVLWRWPATGTKFIIGELTRYRLENKTSYEYRFQYLQGNLPQAMSVGFMLLPTFPDSETVYVSNYLFAVFADRVPGHMHRKYRRPEYDQWMKDWNIIDPNDEFEILAKSGGVRATDCIELRGV